MHLSDQYIMTNNETNLLQLVSPWLLFTYRSPGFDSCLVNKKYLFWIFWPARMIILQHQFAEIQFWESYNIQSLLWLITTSLKKLEGCPCNESYVSFPFLCVWIVIYDACFFHCTGLIFCVCVCVNYFVNELLCTFYLKKLCV